MTKINSASRDNPFLSAMVQAAAQWPGGKAVTVQNKQDFVRQLVQGNSLRDLQKRSTEEAAVTLKSLWEKFQTRSFADIHIDIQEDAFGQEGRLDVTIIQRQMPFITDSILNLFAHEYLSVSVMLNASFRVRRDDEGCLLTMHPDEDMGPDLGSDKVLHLQCEHRGEALDVVVLRQRISDILRDVHAAVEDWRPMQGRIAETIDDLKGFSLGKLKDSAQETADFLTFLQQDNFTFLGYREYTIRRQKNATFYDLQSEKSLGLLRDRQFLLFDGLITDDLIPRKVSELIHGPQPLFMILKANRRATVHRSVHMDVLLVKQYDDQGEVVTLRFFAGLFTSQCYAKPTDQIPYLKSKVNRVLATSGYDPGTHAWRSLEHVLDNYPRDELFQIDTEQLFEHASGINRLNSRPDVDLFIRKDILQRYFSALIYLPREEYDTKLRIQIQNVLEKHLKGHVAAYYSTVDEKPMARLLCMVATESIDLPHIDVDTVRQALVDVCTPWTDRLKKTVLQRFGKKEAQRLLASISQGFSISYQDQVSVEHALEDLEPVQRAMRQPEMVVTLHQRASDAADEYRVKIYKQNDEATLSHLLPILDRMGFHCMYEYAYNVQPTDGLPNIWIHDLVGKIDIVDKEHLRDIEPLFSDTFRQVWNNKIESDGFNGLVLAAGLNAREANLFRAYARYLDLARYPLGRRYTSQVLAKYALITRKLCDAFLFLHDPQQSRGSADRMAETLFVEVEKMLDSVEKLDEDKVLRSMMALIRNTLRTNYFHVDAEGHAPEVLVLKFNAQGLNDLPKPRPFKEIFVFGPRVEAVHLRGGPIARGGIRWSDRFEDFRTEILGLVKAQMVKNSVIVPVGAKGGFICKHMHQMKTPQERQAEGIACYQIMVRGLLSVTDNIIDGATVPPANTVCHDGEDPYLVVAADKGTATFSDIANKLSLEHGFWLGDAFASGGSKGYDHKAMGITARGAWECVKRHFRELGKDIQTEEFTVAGVGDMSGDVFGNGMLLSEKIKLVAVFDHRHIFIDPNPDPKKSHAERKRLFEKPGSSWMDYDPKLISKGGAVFSRQEKSLALTPEIKELLDIEADRLSPAELMQAILRARVELMYLGGIGTYIKASQQSHEQVGDKGNDAIRINASELRCHVLGEGANLAMTQLARIEFAQRGGKLNTDFVDNSAGVDTSDHEVNIKILLQPMIQSKKLIEQEREKLLVSMTGDVGSHVLKNNYDQSLALSLLERRAAEELPIQAQLMRQLEREGLLDRRIEDLPDDDSLQRLLQRRVGLTRPELAVVLAYSKMDLFNKLLATTMPDDVAIAHQAMEYFPDVLQQKYPVEITKHRLHRNIIATEVANVIINRMGPTFVMTKQANSGAAIEQVAKAWLITRAVFDLRTLWEEIDALDNKVPAMFQLSLYEQIANVMQEGVKWFLQNHGDDLAWDKLVPLYRDNLAVLQKTFVDILPPSTRMTLQAQEDKLKDCAALRPDVKKRLVQLPILIAGCDVVRLKQQTKADAADVARVYFTLSDKLHIATIMQQADTLPVSDSWTQEAVEGLRDEVYAVLSYLTREYLSTHDSAKDLEAWLQKRQPLLDPVHQVMTDMAHMETIDLSVLNVAVRRLERMRA